MPPPPSSSPLKGEEKKDVKYLSTRFGTISEMNHDYFTTPNTPLPKKGGKKDEKIIFSDFDSLFVDSGQYLGEKG